VSVVPVYLSLAAVGLSVAALVSNWDNPQYPAAAHADHAVSALILGKATADGPPDFTRVTPDDLRAAAATATAAHLKLQVGYQYAAAVCFTLVHTAPADWYGDAEVQWGMTSYGHDDATEQYHAFSRDDLAGTAGSGPCPPPR